MQPTKFVLTGSAVAALIALAGCGSSDNTERPTTVAPAPATSSAAPAPAVPSEPAVDTAALKEACKDISKDIEDNAGKIAKAQRIGPPAGHYAVSAQWAAGAASIIAHSYNASGEVRTAADAIVAEMEVLGEKSNKAGAEPSETKLDTAVASFEKACAAV